MRRSFWLPTALVCAGLWSGSAWAQSQANPQLSLRPEPPVSEALAVLVLSGEESGVPLSEVYSAARRAIEAHTTINVAPLDAISLEKRDAAIRDCAGQAGCFAAKARSAVTADVGLLLTISLDRLDDGLLLGFRLVDVQTGSQVGASGDEVPLGMSLAGAFEQQLPDVFPRSVWDQVADLKIRSVPANAEVQVGGRTCATPCSLSRLNPGQYEVVIKKSGYEIWRGTTELRSQQTSQVLAELQEPESSIFSSPWFWTLVGAGVVAAGTSAALLSQNTQPDVIVCFAQTQSLCE